MEPKKPQALTLLFQIERLIWVNIQYRVWQSAVLLLNYRILGGDAHNSPFDAGFWY